MWAPKDQHGIAGYALCINDVFTTEGLHYYIIYFIYLFDFSAGFSVLYAIQCQKAIERLGTWRNEQLVVALSEDINKCVSKSKVLFALKAEMIRATLVVALIIYVSYLVLSIVVLSSSYIFFCSLYCGDQWSLLLKFSLILRTGDLNLLLYCKR